MFSFGSYARHGDTLVLSIGGAARGARVLRYLHEPRSYSLRVCAYAPPYAPLPGGEHLLQRASW